MLNELSNEEMELIDGGRFHWDWFGIGCAFVVAAVATVATGGLLAAPLTAGFGTFTTAVIGTVCDAAAVVSVASAGYSFNQV